MNEHLPPPTVISELGPCLIVNKPGGLLTQAPPGIDSIELRIKVFLRHRDSRPGKVYLGVPHRLDRPASGIMLFAKNPRAARRLSIQFENKSVLKKYWAVVEGQLQPDQGTWIDHMRKLPDEAKSEIVAAELPDAQQAVLHYRVVKRNAHCTWLEIQLQTGRTHQIRLQSAHRRHPIIGDALYGAATSFGPETHDARQRWIALHAREIGFEHPMTRQPIRETAELWDHWQQLDFDFETGSALD